MVLHLLQHNPEGGKRLAEVLAEAMVGVGRCEQCRNFSEEQTCRFCLDERRENSTLCVLESPADILAIEQAGGFRGRYFVLHGHLSPIDGIGPEQLGMDVLTRRVAALNPDEVILATNLTVEGEATAYYIHDLLRDKVAKISRIAHGVPLGGELEFIDGGTIVHAMQGRRNFS